MKSRTTQDSVATMDLTVDEDGYNSTDSVGEEAELELSCALHDLALRVKNFEANMHGRFRQSLDDEDEDEEITEDFEHFEEDEDSASPKRKGSRRKRSSDFELAKPQHDDEEDFDDLDSDEEDQPEAKSGRGDAKSSEGEEWDSQEENEEFCEIKHNIAKLLQSMQNEAKAMDNQADCKV